MGAEHGEHLNGKKKLRSSVREMNTALLLLRAVQLGISLSDLDLLTIGMVCDMYTEQLNDGVDYPIEATQEDFDRF